MSQGGGLFCYRTGRGEPLWKGLRLPDGDFIYVSVIESRPSAADELPNRLPGRLIRASTVRAPWRQPGAGNVPGYLRNSQLICWVFQDSVAARKRSTDTVQTSCRSGFRGVGLPASILR